MSLAQATGWWAVYKRPDAPDDAMMRPKRIAVWTNNGMRVLGLRPKMEHETIGLVNAEEPLIYYRESHRWLFEGYLTDHEVRSGQRAGEIEWT